LIDTSDSYHLQYTLRENPSNDSILLGLLNFVGTFNLAFYRAVYVERYRVIIIIVVVAVVAVRLIIGIVHVATRTFL